MRTFALLSSMFLIVGCGSSDGSTSATSTSSSSSAASSSSSSGSSIPYALHVDVKLTSDAQGIPLFTQNGSMTHVPVMDVVGKTYIWATTPGGEPVGNAKLIEFGSGQIDANLQASFTTAKKYTDGPWEMAYFISVAGVDPTKGPQPGDLAAFSLDTPPPGDPPVTGTSIRMDVKDADASVTLDNSKFIRFTK